MKDSDIRSALIQVLRTRDLTLLLDRDQMLDLIEICTEGLGSLRLRDIAQQLMEDYQLPLPKPKQIVWRLAMPQGNLLPNYLFWLTTGICTSINDDSVEIVRKDLSAGFDRTDRNRVPFQHLIVDRQSFNRVVELAIDSYSSGQHFHYLTREITQLDLSDLQELEWVVSHHMPGRVWEAVGLFPAIVREGGRVPRDTPVYPLNIAIEKVWDIVNRR